MNVMINRQEATTVIVYVANYMIMSINHNEKKTGVVK